MYEEAVCVESSVLDMRLCTSVSTCRELLLLLHVHLASHIYFFSQGRYQKFEQCDTSASCGHEQPHSCGGEAAGGPCEPPCHRQEQLDSNVDGVPPG